MTGKIVLLLLIAFGGLSDAALHCYSCQSNCDGSNEVDMDCVSDDLDRCLVSEIAGTKIKGCSLQTGMEWVACVQGKLGQTGDCLRSTVAEVASHMAECSGTQETLMNNTNAAGRQPKQDESYVLCLCSSNLCNTDDLLKGEDGGEGSSTPGGENSSTPGGEASSTPGGENSSTPGGENSSTPGGESSSTPGEGGDDGSGTIGVSAVAIAVSGVILLMNNQLFH